MEHLKREMITALANAPPPIDTAVGVLYINRQYEVIALVRHEAHTLFIPEKIGMGITYVVLHNKEFTEHCDLV